MHQLKAMGTTAGVKEHDPRQAVKVLLIADSTCTRCILKATYG